MLRVFAGSAPLALIVLLLFYFERVEGVRNLRMLFAGAVVLCWWLRSVVSAREAKRAALTIWPRLNVDEDAGRLIDIVRTASWAGLGLWCWSWLVLPPVLIAWPLAGLAIPLLSLRGAFAPTWLAYSGCTDQGGGRAFWSAFRGMSGHRMTGLLVEGLLLLGFAGALANTVATLSLIVLLGRSYLGLDLTTVDTFLSADNPFVIASVIIVTLLVLEPVRVATSATFYVDAQVRKEGLDMTMLVDDAIRSAPPRTQSRTSTGVTAVVLLIAVASFTMPVQAQPLSADDAVVRDNVAEILRRDEFAEFRDEGRSASIRDALRRLSLWLSEKGREQSREPVGAERTSLGIPLPGATVFIVLALVLLLAVGAYLVVTRRSREPLLADMPDGLGLTEMERAPDAILGDAGVLAGRGDYRGALRALYLATLVALDRSGAIRFDPALTNWQYIRQMPRGQERSGFSEFTRLFDYKWYGEEPTTESDYRTCRQLADQICRVSETTRSEASS